MFIELSTGDIVRLKKPHPCGGSEWEIIKPGADVKIKCLRCQHQVQVEREKLLRRIKEVVRSAAHPTQMRPQNNTLHK